MLHYTDSTVSAAQGQMLIEALLVVLKKKKKKNWKQPGYSSTGEQINKLWCISKREYCSKVKRNELSSHAKF